MRPDFGVSGWPGATCLRLVYLCYNSMQGGASLWRDNTRKSKRPKNPANTILSRQKGLISNGWAFPLSADMHCYTIGYMIIYELIWPEDRVEHIARHGVRPAEVEEVCFGRALVQRTKSEGTNPVYYVLGQTWAGRYLFCVVIQFPDGKGFPVTARPMTRKEQQRFNQWKNR
jgi:uncharacterized DUF497 family protein